MSETETSTAPAATELKTDEERAALRETAFAAIKEWVEAELEAGVHPMALMGQMQRAFA